MAVVLAVAVAAAGAPSCTETPTPAVPTRKLSIKIESGGALREGARVDYDTEKTSLTIVARTPWSLTANADWIRPSQTSGAASSNSVPVYFFLDKNEGQDVRTGTVTITTSEAEPYVFTIMQSPRNVLSGVNNWIHKEMSTYYYWNTAVQSVAPPSNSLPYNVFLETLIESLPWSAVQDTSNGENPATIDGHWNRKNDNREANTVREFIYSNVERVAGPTRAGEVTEQTFGLGVQWVNITIGKGTANERVRIVFLVTWVRPDGPAYKSGIRRGTWILRYGGADFTEASGDELRAKIVSGTGSSVNISVGEGNLDQIKNSGGTPCTLASEELPVQPILRSETLSSEGGKKVAYMAYNSFEIDVNLPYDERLSDDRFMKEMRAAFAKFKADGATEMALDLRYNPGGYVAACRILSSLISGAGEDKTFAKMLRNRSLTGYYQNPEVMGFSDEGAGALGLKRLYVLATDGTASASEMVINSLEGIGVDVVVIGKKTNGKNVGMDRRVFTDSSGTYHLWPITFKILNAMDFCDYAGGFTPDREIDEFENLDKRVPLLDLGDVRETLLKEALTHIDTGGFTVAPATRSSARTSDIETMPSPPDPRGGAKYIPGNNR